MPQFDEYQAHGWKLCAVPANSKGPTYEGWNVTPIEHPGEYPGVGLLHALSGTAALDIDDMALAIPWLAERGVDLQALLADPHAVQISSGRPGRAKLLYRMKRPLRTFKPKGSGLELRCATATGSSVQDVLPPSIHPTTKKPYEWAGGILGDWRELPSIPGPLLAAWRELGEPIEAPEPKERKAAKPTSDLAKLRKAVFRHSPDCDYDEWIKVAAQCNDATQGGQAGLDILDEWSKTGTRMCHGDAAKPVYPGKAAIKVHYMSLGGGDGKHIATGEALIGELPPETDDYEVMSDELAAEPAAGTPKATARELLFKKYVFLTLEEDYFDIARGVRIGDKALRHIETPFMPKANGRPVDPINELMQSRAKIIVEAQAFHPGQKEIFEHQGNKFANTFRISSMAEPIEPMKDEIEKIEWLFDRLTDVDFREWLRQFYAHMVQRPAVKMRTAPLIWSKIQGNGKSTMAHLIPQLLAGDQYYTEVETKDLESNFNDYLIGKWVATMTEFRAGTRAERSMLAKKCERWIADDMLSLAIKSGRGCTVPNYLVITASSNFEDAAQIDRENRKWTVYNMSEVPKMTREEKAWIFESFLRTERARGVLRHYFLNVPITTFNPNEDALITKDRLAMIEASLPLDEEILGTAFEQCTPPLDKEIVIVADVADYVRRHSRAQPSNERIGKILAAPPFNGTADKFRAGNGTFRAVIIRNHRRWIGATGIAKMAHIDGNDESIDITS